MRYKLLDPTGLLVPEFCLHPIIFGQADGKYAEASGPGQVAVGACAPMPAYPRWMLANGSASRVSLRDKGKLPAQAGPA